MRTIVDDRGRLFGWVNLLDLLVVVLLVGLVALALVRFVKPEGKQIPIRTAFLVQRVQGATAVQLVPGKEVRDDAGNLLGTVVSAPSAPSREAVGTDQGQLKEAKNPIVMDVNVQVVGEGRMTSSAYKLGNVTIAVGKPVTLIGPGFEVKSTVNGVRPDGRETTLRSTFTVPQVANGAAFAIGTKVFGEAGDLIGTIQSVQHTTSPGSGLDGVVLEVLGKGSATSSGDYIGMLALQVGEKVQLNGLDFEDVQATVTSVKAAK